MRIRRIVFRITGKLCCDLWNRLLLIQLTFNSLVCNAHINAHYAADTLIEPFIWFVDHFTKVLGPFFVAIVVILLTAYIIIAYIIGLPFYISNHSFGVTLIALVIGHWLLINVIFHYYMALMTVPGHPPEDLNMFHAASICKKCIAPKPARTHHCSICNRCILRMDHHCPWLNNCVGHFNHRYFFMFCLYAWLGTVFVMSFGFEIAYLHFWIGENNYLNGADSTINSFVENSDILNESMPISMPLNIDNETDNIYAHSKSSPKRLKSLRHACIVYEALTSIGVFAVLGLLLAWHSMLITRGETSIERHINKKETLRLAKNGRKYINPFNRGPRLNWRIFLGLNQNGISWINVLLPSKHAVHGNGLYWPELYYSNQ